MWLILHPSQCISCTSPSVPTVQDMGWQQDAWEGGDSDDVSCGTTETTDGHRPTAGNAGEGYLH